MNRTFKIAFVVLMLLASAGVCCAKAPKEPKEPKTTKKKAKTEQVSKDIEKAAKEITDRASAKDTVTIKDMSVIQENSMLKTVRMDSVIMKLSHMTVDDYNALELPPMEVLFQNARTQSNQILYYKYEAEYYRKDIQVEKLKPLEWIRGIATYSYGNTDLAAISLMETTYQVWTQNQSTQRSMYWNVGATISIPLSDIFNYTNRINKSRAKLNQTLVREEAEFDVVKQEIIENYVKVVQMIAHLQAAFERKVIAEAQYHFSENDFVNNSATSEELYRSKNYETAAVQDFEIARRDLNVALLTLELVSCTPIVSNFVQFK